MINLQKTKKILKKEIQMYFKQELQYRSLLFVRIFTDILRIFGLCFVWLAVVRNTGAVSQGYILTYYILTVFIARLMSDYTIQQGPKDIITGNFSKYLIKPFSHLVEYLGINIGYNFLRFILSLPALILGVILIGEFWIFDANPYQMFLAILALLGGFVLNFLLGNIFTMLAFFTKEVEGLRIFYFNIVSFLSGEFVPLILMPFTLRFVSEILPFRYTLSFPIEILIGDLGDYDIKKGFVIILIWILILFGSYLLIYRKGVKKYEAEGI